MQCHAHRGDGEPFIAELWFSTYKRSKSNKLAAISTEQEAGSKSESPNFSTNSLRVQLYGREMDVLRLLMQGESNKKIATTQTLSGSQQQNFCRV